MHLRSGSSPCRCGKRRLRHSSCHLVREKYGTFFNDIDFQLRTSVLSATYPTLNFINAIITYARHVYTKKGAKLIDIIFVYDYNCCFFYLLISTFLIKFPGKFALSFISTFAGVNKSSWVGIEAERSVPFQPYRQAVTVIKIMDFFTMFIVRWTL